MYPVALRDKGSGGCSNVGSVANDDDNIASGMRPRSLSQGIN